MSRQGDSCVTVARQAALTARKAAWYPADRQTPAMQRVAHFLARKKVLGADCSTNARELLLSGVNVGSAGCRNYAAGPASTSAAAWVRGCGRTWDCRLESWLYFFSGLIKRAPHR